MSEIIPQGSQSPQPINIREEIVASIRQAAQEERAAAESQAPTPAPEPEADATAALEDEPEPTDLPDEPEPPQVPGQPAPAKRGRKSAEQMIRGVASNLQSLQDRRFNDVQAQIAQLTQAVSQLLKPAKQSEPETDESNYDPEFLKLVEKQAAKVVEKTLGLDRRTVANIKSDAIIREYESMTPELRPLDPLVYGYAEKLAQFMPITKDVLLVIAGETNNWLGQIALAVQQSGGLPTAPGAAANPKPGTAPQNGKPQITPEKAAALRAGAQSMRTESGENVGSDLQQEFSLDREGIRRAFLAAQRKGG